MSEETNERISLSLCDGGARGVEGATPARAQSPESAGERKERKIDLIDLMEAERLVYAFIKQNLSPEDYSRIEQDLRNGKITVYGHTYRLANSAEEIREILNLSWDAPIKVKTSATSDNKIRLDIYFIGETLEQKVVEEKKLQGLSRTLMYKLIRSERKVVIQNIFTGEKWEEVVSMAGFDDHFEDFITGKQITKDEVPDYLGIKVVQCVEVPNPHFRTDGLQKLYVFSDGTVAEFWGYKITGGGREEDLSALESLDAGGEGAEVPVFIFRNREVDRIWKKIYMKAIELFHRREAEEWKRRREQWRQEILELQKKHEEKLQSVEKFLMDTKAVGFIDKEGIEWLKERSPVARDLYLYYDPFEGIEVLWLGNEIDVKVGSEKFRIPVKEVA